MPHLQPTHQQNKMQKLRTNRTSTFGEGEGHSPPPPRPQLPTTLQTTPSRMERQPIHHLLDLRGGSENKRPVGGRPPIPITTRFTVASCSQVVQRCTRCEGPMVSMNNNDFMHRHCMVMHTAVGVGRGLWITGQRGGPSTPLQRRAHVSDHAHFLFPQGYPQLWKTPLNNMRSE